MKEEIKRTKIKLVVSILLCVAILGFIGGTLAWFRYLQQLNTVALVQIPSKITLSGANRSELQKISLELTPDDDITGEGKVTIRRVFCVESTADFRLEVVRTTNIEGMDIKIYPVQTANSDLRSFIPGSGMVKGNDGAMACAALVHLHQEISHGAAARPTLTMIHRIIVRALRPSWTSAADIA